MQFRMFYGRHQKPVRRQAGLIIVDGTTFFDHTKDRRAGKEGRGNPQELGGEAEKNWPNSNISWGRWMSERSKKLDNGKLEQTLNHILYGGQTISCWRHESRTSMLPDMQGFSLCISSSKKLPELYLIFETPLSSPKISSRAYREALSTRFITSTMRLFDAIKNVVESLLQLAIVQFFDRSTSIVLKIFRVGPILFQPHHQALCGFSAPSFLLDDLWCDRRRCAIDDDHVRLPPTAFWWRP